MPERQSSSAGPADSDPSSFFSAFLNPAKKEPDVTVRSMSRSDEELSSRSSGITALPRWDSSLNTSRPKVALPFPIRVHSSHGRKSSKHSQAPILEDDAAIKEAGLQSGLASLGIRRSGSNRSAIKSPQVSGPYGLDDGRQKHSRNLVWLVAVVVAVLALAIILGAVLGTFIKPGPSSPTPQVTEIPAGAVPTPTITTTDSAPSPTGTKTPRPDTQLASVAVTGWRVPGPQGYNSIWLFWQNREGYLSRATYNSSTGNWTRVTNFVKAKKDTPIAAAAANLSYYAGQEAYSFPAGDYQTSVVYLDEKNYLNEWTFSDTGSELGQAGSLNGQKEIALEETRLGFYWPQLVYQGMSGEIRTEYFECHRKDQCWHERVLETGTPSNGTPLVTSPSGNNLSATALFYQAEDGHFVYYTENSKEESQLWQNEAFSHLIPRDAPIASFSTARSDSPADESLNTYLLWQDTNGTIQMSWTDSDDGWKGPITHPAFAGADNNTALTCLTGLTFAGMPLQAGTELSRCYFQTGLALREVSFDGEAWGIVGVVPIDY